MDRRRTEIVLERRIIFTADVFDVSTADSLDPLAMPVSTVTEFMA
jgi:hypothetical protein